MRVKSYTCLYFYFYIYNKVLDQCLYTISEEAATTKRAEIGSRTPLAKTGSRTPLAKESDERDRVKFYKLHTM